MLPEFNIQLKADEYTALVTMLEDYRAFEEEKYNHPEPETLFTKSQIKVFNKFNIGNTPL
jgi:hypothetical protein